MWKKGATIRMSSVTFWMQIGLPVILAGKLTFQKVGATNLQVTNSCGYTMCAKYWCPENGVGGGCSELGPGGSWNVAGTPAWSGATLWGIQGGCSGQACNTGPPSGVTQFEVTLDGGVSGLDNYDISVMAGFNVAMRATPTNNACPGVECAGLTANLCSSGSYPGNTVNEVKTCPYGSTDYNINLCSWYAWTTTQEHAYQNNVAICFWGIVNLSLPLLSTHSATLFDIPCRSPPCLPFSRKFQPLQNIFLFHNDMMAL